jgi:hypothetical protein
MGQDVVAHVYDVATAGSDTTVLHINRFFKDAIGLGGIFHTAIQVIHFSSRSHRHFFSPFGMPATPAKIGSRLQRVRLFFFDSAGSSSGERERNRFFSI